jgi:hypothetical protein
MNDNRPKPQDITLNRDKSRKHTNDELLTLFNELIAYIDQLINLGPKPFRLEYLIYQKNTILDEIHNLKL